MMITQFKAIIAFDSPGKYAFKSRHTPLYENTPIVRLQNLLGNNEPDTTISNEVMIAPTPESETIKHTLIGSSKAVMRTIQILHQLGYAQVSDWSPLLPSPNNPKEMMSILVRNIGLR